MSKETTTKTEIWCDVCYEDLSEHDYLKLREKYSIFRYWKKFRKEGHHKNLQYDVCFVCLDEIGRRVKLAKSKKEK